MISTVLFVCLCTSSAFAGDVVDETCATANEQVQGEQAQALLQAKRNTIKAKAHIFEEQAPVSATGAGAPLTEEGYLIVANQCCNHEMKEFIRRVVFNEGFQVCNEGGLTGITPYYSCQAGPQTLAKLKEELLVNVDWKCPWVDYAAGDCSKAYAGLNAAICPPQPPELPDLDCGCVQGDTVKVDFFGSTLTHSNLGGVGPDAGAQNLVYSNIGTYNGQGLDLIVTADAGYAISVSNPNATNGKRGRFGTINVLGGSTTELTFQIVKTGTLTPQELNEVHFSLFDLDESFAGKMRERFYVPAGYAAFVINKDIEFDIQRTTDGRTAFMSTQYGVGCDNPSDPQALGLKTCNRKDGTQTIDQRKRSVMMVYRKASSWKITVEVTCEATVAGGNEECQSGRNVLFAGESSLVDRCSP